MTQLFSNMGSIILKSLAAAVVLFIMARLMGKKQISQLSFFDYIVGITIGSIAAAASVDRRIPALDAVVSMIAWTVFTLAISYLSIHSMSARRILDGTPLVLIQSGKIVEKNLKKSKLNVNDLLEELRLKDIFNIGEVDYAILETSGKLSVLKADEQKKTSLSANIIIDGKLMKENMQQMHIDESWLKTELAKSGIISFSEILLATCDETRTLHFDKKASDPDDLTVFQ